MSEEKRKPPSAEDIEIERSIRSDRKFSLAEGIGRMAGRNLLKGVSPVSQQRQAELEIERYLERHLLDSQGALEIILLRHASNSEILLEMGYDQPLRALTLVLERLLNSESHLQRFVRNVDAEWGRIYLERPHFQKEGDPPDQEDPYTHSSVRITLSRLVEKLRGE